MKTSSFSAQWSPRLEVWEKRIEIIIAKHHRTKRYSESLERIFDHATATISLF
jgi:hypothetical protein